MRFDSLLIAIVVVGMVATGFGLFITEVGHNYNVPVDEQLSTVYGNQSLTNKLMNQTSEELKKATSEDPNLLTSSIASINIVKNIFVTGIPATLGLVGAMGNVSYMPPYIINGIKAILIISMAFALVYLLLRYQNE
jgi:hypothetical protein